MERLRSDDRDDSVVEPASPARASVVRIRHAALRLRTGVMLSACVRLLAPLALSACDAGGMESPVAACAVSVDRNGSEQSDRSDALDGTVQCDASCPAECAIQSNAYCLPTAEALRLEVATVTGPNESVAPLQVLVSREYAVAAQRTPLSGTEAAKRLDRAYRRVLGRHPSPEALALLTAHWAHETNQGAAMYNYNFGGIKGVGPSGAYAIHKTREGSGVRERRRSYQFRAYSDATAGAVDYVSLLQRLYGPALEAASRGDVVGFVTGLKQGGYFSGDEGIYLQKVADFVNLSEEYGFDALGPSGISPRHRPSRERAAVTAPTVLGVNAAAGDLDRASPTNARAAANARGRAESS